MSQVAKDLHTLTYAAIVLSICGKYTNGITAYYYIEHIYYHLIFNKEVCTCVNEHLRCNRIRVSARQHEFR